MEIKIEPEQIQGLVEKAILETIDQETRDLLLANAVKHLMTPDKPPYSSGPLQTPLQRVFEQALVAAARNIVDEFMQTDEAQKAVLSAVSPAIAEIVKGTYGELDELIGTAIGDSVVKWLRNR